jgi:hypothetical protein
MNGAVQDCSMMMGSMGWLMPVVGIAFLALLGLGIAALVKYLFSSQKT